MFELVLYIIAAYLLGSIPFSVIMGYAFSGVDVRKHGSGNAGATNVYRVAGLIAAILAAIFDIIKGIVPVLGANLLLPQFAWLPVACGFAAVLGHVLPVFAGFKGGKGVNTLLGMYIVLLPLEVGISVLIFGGVFALTRIVSLGSIVAGVSLSLIVLIEKYLMGKNISPLLLSACIVVSFLVLFTHRVNIQRLIKGEERKLTH